MIAISCLSDPWPRYFHQRTRELRGVPRLERVLANAHYLFGAGSETNINNYRWAECPHFAGEVVPHMQGGGEEGIMSVLSHAVVLP